MPGRITSLVRRQTEEEEKEDLLQAKAIAGRTPLVLPDVAKEIAVLQGGGQPLSESERTFFEPRFGYDFASVRVHTNRRAADLVREIRARAFTLGTDVVFGPGQFAPQSGEGRRLLAHELTHVVQQTTPKIGSRSRSLFGLPQSSPAVIQRDGPQKEKTALEKLDEVLDQPWPSDENILARLRELSGAEKQIVVAGENYRDDLVYQLSDDNMFKALNILNPNCAIRVNWLKAQGVKLNYLWFENGFLESTDDGCSLDQELKKRVINLCECLNALRLIEPKDFPATSGCRTKKRAHQLSTGYHINTGFISLNDLQAYLPQGPGNIGNEVIDADGNLWYVRGWTLAQTKDNAKKIYTDKDKGNGDPLIPLAYEGYEVGDPRRHPNTNNPNMPIVSSHVYGQAIDLSRRRMPWKKDPWDPEHERVIHSYSLARPVNSSSPYGPTAAEFWHYEKTKASPGKSPVSVPGPCEPGPRPEPEPRKPDISEQMITNTAGVRLIREDPLQWENEAFIIKRLPRGTRVTALDKGVSKSFNQTDSEYQWWQIEVAGIQGWVMQVLLDPYKDNP
ncbi:MAG: DUF4157 domain-containing protein [Desulfobacterales bacterium]|nr:MAG: DUF4157 domain-containing protein [Desulfobacterales bacterium]